MLRACGHKLQADRYPSVCVAITDFLPRAVPYTTLFQGPNCPFLGPEVLRPAFKGRNSHFQRICTISQLIILGMWLGPPGLPRWGSGIVSQELANFPASLSCPMLPVGLCGKGIVASQSCPSHPNHSHPVDRLANSVIKVESRHGSSPHFQVWDRQDY